MSIKQEVILTQVDFEQATKKLHLSVSEVSRDTCLPRHLVSRFRNHGDGLKTEQLIQLRTFFESKGIEFSDEQETPVSTNGQPKLPFILSDDGLTQRTLLAFRHFFIDERLTDEQIKEAGKRFEDEFNQAKELLGIELGREWLSDKFDEATDIKMRELWGHLARIGLLSLHLQGRILLDQERILANSFAEDEKSKPITLGDFLSDTYSETVAGLNASEVSEQAEAEEAEATS